MLNAIIQFSIRNKLIVGIMVAALIVAGIIHIQKLPIDALPDITSNQVQVITVSPALAAPEVERLVTFTVEQNCSNIQGITEMRSISRFGLSVVTIVFNDETDIYWARQQVAERLPYIKDEIPPGAGSPTMAPLTTGLGEVYQYIVKAAPGYEGKYSLADLRTIQDWQIRRQLLGTKGVADVSSFGGHLKQYEIAFRAEKLNSMGLSIADVYNALQKNNQNSGGAYIEKNDQVLFIRTEGLIEDIRQIESIMLNASANGSPVYVRDVATVKEGHAIRYGALVDGSKGEVSGAVVLMLKGANGMDVVNQVKAKMEVIKKSLPEGVLVETFYDRSKMVERSIKTVKTNLSEGALIVVLVLVLFLGNLRAGLIVASVIPLAMLFAIIMMNLFGVSGNLMSLGALDFGLIVDGAVIIVEAVLHRLHHKKIPGGITTLSQEQMNHEVENAAGKMMNAAVFGQVIILIVYLPILALVGIEGKMFKPMAQTVSFALVGAFLLSLTYVPMITSLGIGKKISSKVDFSDKFMALVEKSYLPFLQLALRFKKSLMVLVVVVFATAIALMTTLGGEFIPELEEGDFAVDTRLLTGSSLTASVEASQKAAAILEARFPEVEKIVSRIGASEIPTDPMPIEMGDLIILLKDKKQWTSAESYDELADKMSAALSEVPGLSAGFQFPVQMRFNELISGARQDVVCKIFGEDLDSLATYAAKIGAIAERVEGASDLYIEAVTGLPQIVVKYDRDAMALYGVNVNDVNQIVRTAFAGESAGLVYEKEKRFDLVMRLENSSRQDVSNVQQLLVPTAQGTQIPMYMVAKISIEEGPNQIQRENASRRIIVAFNVRNRDVESVVHELQDKVGAQVKLPAGYYLHFGGAFENLNAAKNRLMIAVPASLAMIFLLLFFAFKSFKHSLLIFTAIPLSAIGGVFALWLRDMPFSISAGVGFIALFGVAVLNGIVLITEFNRLKKEGKMSLQELIVTGTHTRLRPVLMTAAVASLGFMPMALSHSAGAEVQRPLASVVIGGLITATFLTLIVLPVLYQWVETNPRMNRKKFNPTAAIIILLMLGAGITAQAQQKVTLEQAFDLLPKQNITLKAGQLQQQYLQALQATAGEMPRTRIVAELGQTNSVNFDTRFMMSQTFLPFGSVAAQKQVFQSAVFVFEKEMQLRVAELRLMVRQHFANYGYQQERKFHLQMMDSLYERQVKLATQRLQAGETNKLELAGYRQQQQLVRQATQTTDIAMQREVLQLQVLLQTTEVLQPVVTNFKSAELLPDMDSTAIAQHPAIQIVAAQAKAAAAETKYLKTLRKPELEVGYNNQSLIGFQTSRDGTDKFYEAGTRFSAAQVGVSFPLFGKASKAKIKASALREQTLLQQQQMQQQQLSGSYQLKWKETQLLWQQVQSIEKELLPGKQDILLTAQQQLKAGELNYMNWMLIVEPALQVQLQYLDSWFAYRTAVAELQYLQEKN
ncbi:CusA/CzcA family heavy metal efflux RND transporter [Phnomibacter sp. MR]|uniref:CusA/CzcA family heavy metal efflux RND transporter n=1 Tax=Phnomibacter sp. MR TaxID=3042318 RepID=UPI003A803A5B